MRSCFAKIFLAFLLCSTGIITSINSLDLDINEEIVLNPNTVIVAFKERFDKKIKQLDFLLAEKLTVPVMSIIYEETIKVRELKLTWFDNSLFAKENINYMLDKLAYWHQKLTTSTINGDEQLKTYLKNEVRVKALNLEIVKVINDINNKDYSINNLREKLHQYDLIMRELQESDVQSWTEKFVFSISLYEQYMEFNKLVYADLKSNIHSYLGVFVDEMNKQLQKLIINMESNSEQDFKMIVSFKQKLQQFQEDILYLKRDDFIREFPIKFMEINNNLHQAMLLLATQEKQMITSFISHFKEWKATIIKQKEKITESGVWEKIEKLNQMFNASYTNLKQVEKASQDFNFSVVHKLVKEIQDVINTIEYKGINAIVIENKKNPNIITHYMSDDQYAAKRAKQYETTFYIDIFIGIPVGVGTTTKIGTKVAKVLVSRGKIVRWVTTGIASIGTGVVAGALLLQY